MRLTIVFAFLVASLLTGCSPTRAPNFNRSGGIVYFYGTKLELSEMSVSNVTERTFDKGIEVPPGTHTFRASFSMTDELCPPHAAFCFYETYQGKCEGTVAVQVGKEYGIKVSNGKGIALVKVIDKGSLDTAGSGNCATLKTRLDQGAPYL